MSFWSFTSRNVGFEQDLSAQAVVSSDGTVLWVSSVKLTVSCSKNLGWWGSKETWSASFKFGSWTYNGFNIDLDFYDDLEMMDLTDFYSLTYTIDVNKGVKNVKYYPCCVEPYPDMTFELSLLTV